eukprot:CAMPEP_0179138702 /NCGR_PEP_ID=MMETSP0796-20121207/66264_1 /TAXON_ID=73915 /ORGANISM="Pyrodinium bahamense, Strain pbaha01" /LENGTH=332 /DNA_ID=CAMNT_0020838017 /DNA_START=30 /DNA_END=1028 /DNA_ORIENTATION=-
MVFGGCMSSIVFMEYVLKGDPDAGNLMNATEFVFVLLQSIPGRLERRSGSHTWKLRPLLAPWSSHVQHALLWVSMSVMANYVFGYNISVPIHTLFRSCNVIASVALGLMVFDQQYSLQQVACVCVITVGIFLGSIGDARKFTAGCSGSGCGGVSAAWADSEQLGKWAVGIAMLGCVQVIQGTLGHVQAVFYRRFQDRGTKNDLADEYLFTSHVASLLAILILWRDIARSARAALATPPLSPLFPLPRRLMWVIANNFTQLACIKGVFRLSAHYSPLTTNITLSVRKFMSLVLSIVWFGNVWTHLHSIATVAIFSGVFAYSQCKPPEPRKKVE